MTVPFFVSADSTGLGWTNKQDFSALQWWLALWVLARSQGGHARITSRSAEAASPHPFAAQAIMIPLPHLISDRLIDSDFYHSNLPVLKRITESTTTPRLVAKWSHCCQRARRDADSIKRLTSREMGGMLGPGRGALPC
jgi:hypothetical protein